MQLPGAGGVGETSMQGASPCSTALTPKGYYFATKARNHVCSQDEVDRYLMKEHDQLQTDGVLCPHQRWALSPVLPVTELPLLQFGAAEFGWKVMVAVSDGGDGSVPAAGLCPQHQFGTTLSAPWLCCS